MSLEEKKQNLGGGGIKREMPLQKEAEKDTSLFRGRSHLGREEIRESLRKGEAHKFFKGTPEKRAAFEKKIFSQKNFKEFIDPNEVKNVHKEIKDFPIHSKEKYGIKDEGERLRILEWLEEKMGAK